MDWQQTLEDTVPSAFVTERQLRSVIGKPPATGAWREGDHPGGRRFVEIGPFAFEAGGRLPHVRVAYESWGELSPARDNAILVLHALTGDSHLIGRGDPGHATDGW